jgi:sentrin-specific protease 6
MSKASVIRKVLANRRCFILTFDSLGGPHKAVATHLQRWLQFEARDKNFSDCGLWLIHYVKNLLLHSEEIIRFVQVSAMEIDQSLY